MTGFPNDLWSRQSTDDPLRPTGWPTWTCTPPPNTTGFTKTGGSDNVTTIYMGEGPLEKYQTVGRIDSTDWRTGQPRLDVNVIACTHIQVVYSGVNITSPSTCAQATLS